MDDVPEELFGGQMIRALTIGCKQANIDALRSQSAMRLKEKGEADDC